MKKKTILGLIFIAVSIVGVFFIYRLVPTLLQRPPEKRIGNVLFFPDTLPKEYSILFNAEQLNHIAVSSITYNEGYFPICVMSFMEQYDIIIFKKRIDTNHFQLSNFLEVERPLRTNLVNDRRYITTDGYINFQWATATTTKPLSSILMTISDKGALRQEIANKKEAGYIIDDWQKINFFYEEQKNADLIFEMNPLPFEKATTAIGLILKQVDNDICLIFLLPKNKDSPPVSKELLQKLW